MSFCFVVVGWISLGGVNPPGFRADAIPGAWGGAGVLGGLENAPLNGLGCGGVVRG